VSRNDPELNWQPTCEHSALIARAELYATIRRFFSARGVLEVETPLLCRHTGTDPNLQPFLSHYHRPGEPAGRGLPLYLQTSPEFAMKRLLAAGSGSIYQICKAFRNEESGRYHNPEFTLLEWYRVGFELTDLMDEIDALLSELLTPKRPLGKSKRLSYREAFLRWVGADPLSASLEELSACAKAQGLEEATRLCGQDRTLWLDLLFSHKVQPHLGREGVSFVHDYPALLPSLARSKPGNDEVVERVEIFLDGMELGNGFRELADPKEQERRFDADLAVRRSQGQPEPEKDSRLLAALAAGLPDCSGIAIGLDRLLMIMTGAKAIDEVLAFLLARA
jgi:elongation factor P--(R)-beta-lysine ligase